MYSLFILVATMNSQVEQGTLVAAGIGAAITFLFTVGKVKPISRLIGYIASAFFAAYYFCSVVVAKHSDLRPDAVAFAISFSAFLWIPLGTKYAEAWVKRKEKESNE